MAWVKAVYRAEPPLLPSPDEGRSLLRRELLDPGYHDQNLLQQALTWLGRVLDDGLRTAQAVPEVSSLVAMALLVAALLALTLLASRARTSAGARREPGQVITTEQVSADQLRTRAIRAREEGRHDDAVLEAFRALARRHVERGILPEDPGATAREVADRLAAGLAAGPDAGPGTGPGAGPGAGHGGSAGRLREIAGLFDAVLYGGLPAGPQDSAAALALDDDLAGVR